ncbi:MAG: hypothetical protein H7A51_15595 [Akkermansiaceae bacterium]|nr:hypothetical protein [Akkermansiaceae bacterium]
MTVITLTDVAEARLQSVSFFCVVYLLLAWGVKLLWNYLAKSFGWMPRINYRRALALMLVSGLFLYVILTMISGARELLTPGAWKKQGIGYELSSGEKPPSKEVRKEAIQKLKTKLWVYAREHDGKLPHGIFDKSFDSYHWALPEVTGYYAYIPTQKLGGGRDILVYEPGVMGRKRFVILTDGSVEAWSEDTLRTALERDE